MSHYYRPEHTVTVDTANGMLSCSSSDWLIGKILFTRREFELDLIRDSMELLRGLGLLKQGANRTIVDVGANIGMITTAMLREGYFEHAIAFEPSPRNFELLQKNIDQNGLGERVDPFEVGLTSADGEIEFELSKDNSGDSRVRVGKSDGLMGEQHRSTLEVNGRSFDSLLRERTEYADRIDLIWMDVQGHEGHFFKGAREFLTSHKTPVVTEFWAYGIERSGMGRADYCEIVSELFSTYHAADEGGFSEHSTANIAELFEKYRGPRQGTNIILVK